MEWTESAQLALRSADRPSTDKSARQLFAEVVEGLEPVPWMRFRVRIDHHELAQLVAPSQFFAHAPMEQVRRAAPIVAASLGEDRVDIGAVALAWALTARSCPDELLISLNECMGKPALELADAAALRDHVLRELLLDQYSGSKAGPSSGSKDDEIPSVGCSSTRARKLESVFERLSIVVRCTAAGALLSRAVAGHGWWLAIFALGVLVATQPSNRSAALLSDTTRPWVLATRLPWTLMCATVLCLFDRRWEALLVAGTWLLVRCCAHAGEYVTAQCSAVQDDSLPKPLTVFVRAAQSFVVRNQVYDTVTAITSGVIVTAVAWLGDTSTDAVSAIGLGLWAVSAVESSNGRWTWMQGIFKVFALISLGLLTFDLGWFVLIAPVTVSGAMAAVRRNHRVRPRSLRSTSRRPEQEAWRWIATGRLNDVITAFGPIADRSDELTAALALAYVRSDQPGTGRRLAGDLPTACSDITVLIDAEVSCAFGRIATVHPNPSADDALGAATELARLRSLIPHVNPLDLAVSLAELIPARITLTTLPFAAECYLAIGDTLRGWAPGVATVAVSRAWGMTDFLLQHDREFLTRDQAEARMLTQPITYQLGAHAGALLSMYMGEEEESPGLAFVDDDALQVLTELTTPVTVAAYCNRGADLHNQRQGITGAGVDLRVQAFAALNDVRHTLTDPDDRELWWSKFTPTLDALLNEAFHRRDWPLLLEVIEAARLQLGISREDLRPIALRVAGKSRVASAKYMFGRRPQSVNLIDVMRSAGGDPTWWWATHVSEGYLYWAFAATDGTMQGGRTPWAKVHDVLSELDTQLSFQAADESIDDFHRRLSVSILLDRPSPPEEALAAKIGALLPDVLVAAATSSVRGTLCLAIAPELARVPWAWVVTGDRRLVEIVDPVVVPPASVLNSIAEAHEPPDQLLPVSVAVLDPGGDLPGGQQASSHIPDETATVTATTQDPLTTLRHLLSEAAYDSTLVLACHTMESDGRRGFVLGPLNTPGTPEVLFASDIADARTPYPMPRQVVALACASSEVTNVRRGEWTVLGTALIQAGSKRAVVTAFPVLDLPEVDRTILEGVQDGTPLHVLIATLQLTMLDRWRRGDPSAAPLMWAGLQMFGCLPKQARTTEPRPQAWVEESLVKGIDAAADLASPERDTVTVVDLMAYFAAYGHLDGLPSKQRWAVRRKFLLRPALRHLRHQGSAPQQHRLGDDLVEVLRDARDLASEAGHQVYDINHVFLAALRSQYPAAVAMRGMTGFDGRNPAVVQRFLEGSNDGWHYTGRATTSHLASDDVRGIYDLFGVAPPTGEDRWLHSDRLAQM